MIEELIALAKEMREANARGEAFDLTEDELAFYDALETNDSAVKVLGDETLRTIARELVSAVRSNVTIDWTLRENVRAQLRVLVKRILRKHGYPPDKQEKATQTVGAGRLAFRGLGSMIDGCLHPAVSSRIRLPRRLRAATDAKSRHRLHELANATERFNLSMPPKSCDEVNLTG